MIDTIAGFNKKLNASLDPVDNWIRWKAYRDELTGFILKDIQRVHSSCIIGGGHLNDIDVSEVSKMSKQLDIYDIDPDTVEKALQRQGHEPARSNILGRDLTGLDDMGFFRQLISLISSKDTAGYKAYLDDAAELSKSTDAAKKYDLTIVLPIYTQLLIQQFLWILEEHADKKLRGEYAGPFMYFISSVIRNVNARILKMTGRHISVTSDIMEYVKGDPALKDIEKNIDDVEYIDKVAAGYHDTYGEGLGSYGIKDISEKLKVSREKWFLWDYSEKVSFLTRSIFGQIKKTKNV